MLEFLGRNKSLLVAVTWVGLYYLGFNLVKLLAF